MLCWVFVFTIHLQVAQLFTVADYQVDGYLITRYVVDSFSLVWYPIIRLKEIKIVWNTEIQLELLRRARVVGCDDACRCFLSPSQGDDALSEDRIELDNQLHVFEAVMNKDLAEVWPFFKWRLVSIVISFFIRIHVFFLCLLNYCL